MYYSFAKQFGVFVFIASTIVVLVNFFVNPFDIYPSPEIQGFNQFKYENRDRMSIAINLAKHKPKIVIFGTSRVVSGFDTKIFSFDQGDMFFNAGLAAACFDEIYAYFLHALYVQPDLKIVILGIDLLSFNANRKPQSTFKIERLNRNHMTISDLRGSLFSRKAIKDSYECFSTSFLNKKKPILPLDWTEEKYFHNMLMNPEDYGSYQLDLNKIKKFSEIVDICKKKGIALKVFICPVKAMYWDFYFKNGLWTHMEELMRRLCSIYPLWDFSGFNLLTTESIQSDGIPLYFECSHFTPYVGNLLLHRMFDRSSYAPTFGALLTPETIHDVLIQTKKNHEHWLKSQKK